MKARNDTHSRGKSNHELTSLGQVDILLYRTIPHRIDTSKPAGSTTKQLSSHLNDFSIKQQHASSKLSSVLACSSKNRVLPNELTAKPLTSLLNIRSDSGKTRGTTALKQSSLRQNVVKINAETDTSMTFLNNTHALPVSPSNVTFLHYSLAPKSSATTGKADQVIKQATTSRLFSMFHGSARHIPLGQLPTAVAAVTPDINTRQAQPAPQPVAAKQNSRASSSSSFIQNLLQSEQKSDYRLTKTYSSLARSPSTSYLRGVMRKVSEEVEGRLSVTASRSHILLDASREERQVEECVNENKIQKGRMQEEHLLLQSATQSHAAFTHKATMIKKHSPQCSSNNSLSMTAIAKIAAEAAAAAANVNNKYQLLNASSSNDRLLVPLPEETRSVAATTTGSSNSSSTVNCSTTHKQSDFLKLHLGGMFLKREYSFQAASANEEHKQQQHQYKSLVDHSSSMPLLQQKQLPPPPPQLSPSQHPELSGTSQNGRGSYFFKHTPPLKNCSFFLPPSLPTRQFSFRRRSPLPSYQQGCFPMRPSSISGANKQKKIQGAIEINATRQDLRRRPRVIPTPTESDDNSLKSWEKHSRAHNGGDEEDDNDLPFNALATLYAAAPSLVSTSYQK